jgi:hypothetical protein
MGTLRVKSNGQWVDVITGTAARAGFWRRGSSSPSCASGAVTLQPLDVLVSTGNWQWTYASTQVTCPVAGVYAIRGSIAAPGVAFPSGSMVMIYHYPGGVAQGIARSRAAANRQNAYETLETHCELPLAVGDKIGLIFYHEQGSNYQPRYQNTDSSLDPYTPSMSCWRISY